MIARASLEPNVLGDAPARGTPWLSGVAIFLVVMTPLLAYLAPLGFAPLLALAGLLALQLESRLAIDVSKLKDYGDIESLTALKLFLQLATYGAAVVGPARPVRRRRDGARRRCWPTAWTALAADRRARLSDRRGRSTRNCTCRDRRGRSGRTWRWSRSRCRPTSWRCCSGRRR
jgi:hypothetical protein